MPRAAPKRLTAAALDSAKALPGERVELWDSQARGLCLRVSPSSKVWVFRYRTADGRQPRLVLGEYPGLKLEPARAMAHALRSEVKGGSDPQGEKKRRLAEAKAQTLRTMTDLRDAYFLACENGDYTPSKRQKRASTLAMEQGLWKRHLAGALGILPIDDLNKATIRNVLRTIKATAPVQANRCHGLINRMCNFALWDGRLMHSPMVGVDVPATETPRQRVLADPEIRSLWATLTAPGPLSYERDGEKVKAHLGRPVAIALQLALLTLQRRGEIAGMRKDELRLDEGVWLIEGGRAKRDATHLVPLSPPVVALIREALALQPEPEADEQESPFVFPSPKNRQKPINPNALTHAAGEVYPVAALTDATVHDLRRTGATLMASERLGISPFVVSLVLGHKSDKGGGAAVTMRSYNVYQYTTEKRAALNAWAALLGIITEGREAGSNVTPLRS